MSSSINFMTSLCDIFLRDISKIRINYQNAMTGSLSRDGWRRVGDSVNSSAYGNASAAVEYELSTENVLPADSFLFSFKKRECECVETPPVFSASHINVAQSWAGPVHGNSTLTSGGTYSYPESFMLDDLSGSRTESYDLLIHILNNLSGITLLPESDPHLYRLTVWIGLFPLNFSENTSGDYFGECVPPYSLNGTKFEIDFDEISELIAGSPYQVSVDNSDVGVCTGIDGYSASSIYMWTLNFDG